MSLYNYNEKDLLMLYHTGIRNIGLYASLSFGLLGISRFYRGKGLQMYNITFILLSSVFICISIYLSILLTSKIESSLQKIDKKKESDLYKWLMLPKMLVYMNIVILLFSGYTLYRQVKPLTSRKRR